MPRAVPPHQHTANWIPIHEAAELTGLSLRSLQRLIAAKQIQAAQQPRPGRRPVTVIHPADVQQLQADRQPGQFAITAPAPSPTADAHLPPHLDPLHAIAALMLAREARESLQLRPLWLNIDSAAEYSGLTPPTLRRLARSGTIPTIKDGHALKFRRADLDKLTA